MWLSLLADDDNAKQKFDSTFESIEQCKIVNESKNHNNSNKHTKNKDAVIVVRFTQTHTNT